MKNEQHKCLFDYWQKNSAPMFHSSRFWPQTNESDIAAFIAARQVPGELPVAHVDVSELVAYKHKIETFVQFAKTTQDYDQRCVLQYVLFEQERLLVLQVILDAYSNKDVAAHNAQLYGTFEQLLAEQCCMYVAKTIQAYAPTSELGIAAKQSVLAMLPTGDTYEDVETVFIAFETTKQQVQPVVDKRFAFVNTLNLPPSSTAEQVQVILQNALQHILPDSEWNVRCVDGAPNAHIDYDTKSIVLPLGRSFTSDHVKSLIVHEIGVHVVRSYNGFATCEKLAGYGLYGYGHVEEAMGVLLENAFTRTPSSISSLVPTIALYVGTKRSFTFGQMYTFLLQLLICLKGDEAIYSTVPLQRAAFSRAIRMMRFGNGKIVDFSSTKYWYGMIELSKMYTAITEHDIHEFMVAKYDTTNAAQKQLL